MINCYEKAIEQALSQYFEEWELDEYIRRRDITEDDLKDLVLGHKIVFVDTERNSLLLDSGVVLTVESVHECCAWFQGIVHEGKVVDNVVTAVNTTYPENPSAEEEFTIHIIADSTEVANINVTGDPSSGYYCHSVSLQVREVDLGEWC